MQAIRERRNHYRRTGLFVSKEEQATTDCGRTLNHSKTLACLRLEANRRKLYQLYEDAVRRKRTQENGRLKNGLMGYQAALLCALSKAGTCSKTSPITAAGSSPRIRAAPHHRAASGVPCWKRCCAGRVDQRESNSPDTKNRSIKIYCLLFV